MPLSDILHGTGSSGTLFLCIHNKTVAPWRSGQILFIPFNRSRQPLLFVELISNFPFPFPCKHRIQNEALVLRSVQTCILFTSLEYMFFFGVLNNILGLVKSIGSFSFSFDKEVEGTLKRTRLLLKQHLDLCFVQPNAFHADSH